MCESEVPRPRVRSFTTVYGAAVWPPPTTLVTYEHLAIASADWRAGSLGHRRSCSKAPRPLLPPSPSMWIAPWQPNILPLILKILLSRDSRWNKKSERCHMGCEPRNPRPRCSVEPPEGTAGRRRSDLFIPFAGPLWRANSTLSSGERGARSAPRALTFYSIYLSLIHN